MDASKPTSAVVSVSDAHEADIQRLVALWNRDLPEDLPASPRLLEWTLSPHPGRTVRLVIEHKREINAYAIVSKMEGSPLGIVDALVPAKRNGRESALCLVEEAQRWVHTQGATAIQFGGGAYSIQRGIPVLGKRPLDGWTGGVTRPVHNDDEVDLALDLSRYVPPTDMEPVAGMVQPAQPRDKDELETFFGAPESIHVAANNDLAQVDDLALAREIAFGGRISDLMLLFTARGVEGICHLIFADSSVPIDLAYPYTLPRPWGAIGVVAVSDRLGTGAIEMLLDAAARRLHNNGINSCVALGIAAPVIYECFGFTPYRHWRQRARVL